ncbi:uncharacterized protein LOC143295491 isoform X2 [Babylonia areolata]|uniref:uncharacterized protein LOC143295491 isoform X2 n=1 Tax=Babylonia areolata TaxID=304850 RepID=UPI003FCF7D56
MDSNMTSAKPKNGKTSSQDYMNLLYSDSESDSVPDLKLPPLRGKKQRRRGLRRQSDDGVCSLWMILKIIIFSVLLVSIITLGVVTYLTQQQISELKDHINTLENKNADISEELKDLSTKLKSVNTTTVLGQKTVKYGLDNLNRTISSMQKQITALNATSAVPQKGNTENTKETETVAKTVANIGSDLGHVETTVESLKSTQSSFTSQIKDLTSRITALERPGGREGGSTPSDVPDIEALLAEMNATFTHSLEQAMAQLDNQQTQLDAMGQFTQEVDGQVKNVSQAVANLTLTQQSLARLPSASPLGQHAQTEGEEGGDGQEVKVTLTQLQSQVQSLQLLVDQMQNRTQAGQATDGSEGTASSLDVQSLMKDHEDFVVFRTEVYEDIHSLNSTLDGVNMSVGTLNQDVDLLFSKLGTAMADISNVTSIVEGLTRLFQSQRDNNNDDKSKASDNNNNDNNQAFHTQASQGNTTQGTVERPAEETSSPVNVGEEKSDTSPSSHDHAGPPSEGGPKSGEADTLGPPPENRPGEMEPAGNLPAEAASTIETSEGSKPSEENNSTNTNSEITGM